MTQFYGLELPSRVASALGRSGITTIEELIKLNMRELRALSGIDRVTLTLIVEALAEADLILSADPWAPYVCVRHGDPAGDAGLATFFLCPDCSAAYAEKAFSNAKPEWRSTEFTEGYCGHCNRRRADIAVVQWHLCSVCERVIRSLGRGLAAARHVLEVWEQRIAPAVPHIVLTETDPPELRPRGQRSAANRRSYPDFTAFHLKEPDAPLFGFELKSGKKAASVGGVGEPMSRLQLDTTDCDDLLAVVSRERIPIYLIHVQVIGRAYPPTERFNGLGFWWTDIWAMQSNFLNVDVRSRETRNAAYYDVHMFRGVNYLANHLASDGYALDRKRLEDGGLRLYRMG